MRDLWLWRKVLVGDSSRGKNKAGGEVLGKMAYLIAGHGGPHIVGRRTLRLQSVKRWLNGRSDYNGLLITTRGSFRCSTNLRFTICEIQLFVNT